MKKVAISGYFDPIHVGHIEYIKTAKKLPKTIPKNKDNKISNKVIDE